MVNMSTYSVYKTDKTKEEAGSWATLSDGSEWLVARANSKRSQKALADAERPHKQLMRQVERTGRKLPDEIQEGINLEWTVHGIVLGWKGVTGPDGADLPFSEANLRMVLTDLPDLHLEVIRLSTDVAQYQNELNEDDIKN